MIIVFTILLTGAIAGFGTYFWQAKNLQNQRSESDKRIDVLQKQIQDLKKQLSTEEPSINPACGSVSTDEKAEWDTYTSKKYGFCFKYPKSWSIKETDETRFNDAREYAIVFNSGSMENSYFVDVYKLGSQTQRQFIDNWFGNIENGPSNISNDTINNQPVYKFFMSKAGLASGGDACVLFSRNTNAIVISNQKIGKVSDIMEDTILNQLASTMRFAQ